ncbi:hypothetical protein M8J76_007589 [Diaphorina citri]|nr:hypothetical protein M8J76_007589 [Diaphorina citri]
MSTKTERSPAFFSESLFYFKEKNDARRARLLHIHTADKTFSSCISIERELAPIVKISRIYQVQGGGGNAFNLPGSVLSCRIDDFDGKCAFRKTEYSPAPRYQTTLEGATVCSYKIDYAVDCFVIETITLPVVDSVNVHADLAFGGTRCERKKTKTPSSSASVRLSQDSTAMSIQTPSVSTTSRETARSTKKKSKQDLSAKPTKTLVSKPVPPPPAVSIPLEDLHVSNVPLSRSFFQYTFSETAPGPENPDYVSDPAAAQKLYSRGLNHVDWTDAQWDRVLFSDETRVCLNSPDGRERVLRRRGERFTDACMSEREPYGGGSVMFWAGISSEGRTELVSVPSPTLNAERDPAPATLPELEQAAKEEWRNIPQEMFRNLVRSMKRRLQAVIKNRGGNTSY